jgi:hypothetical protein
VLNDLELEARLVCREKGGVSSQQLSIARQHRAIQCNDTSNNLDWW